MILVIVAFCLTVFFYRLNHSAVFGALNIAPNTAPTNIIGTNFIGKIIIKSKTVANGFWRICEMKTEVITAVAITGFRPNKSEKPYPRLIPAKIIGKKCPPFNPDSIQILVSKIFTTPIKINMPAPIATPVPKIVLICSSPENIVSGRKVPIAPRVRPPTAHLKTTYFFSGFKRKWINLWL